MGAKPSRKLADIGHLVSRNVDSSPRLEASFPIVVNPLFSAYVFV